MNEKEKIQRYTQTLTEPAQYNYRVNARMNIEFVDGFSF